MQWHFLHYKYNDYTAMTRSLELGSGISSSTELMIMPPWLRLKRIVCEKRAAHEGNVDIKVKRESIFRFALHHIVIADDRELKFNVSLKVCDSGWFIILTNITLDILHCMYDVCLVYATSRKMALLLSSGGPAVIILTVCHSNIRCDNWDQILDFSNTRLVQ
jgi:hypothetical protein